MELCFLGTGGAWGLPEHACPCATCQRMRALGQHRGRAGLWLSTAAAGVLIDPGPDLRAQMMANDLPRPDAVLISHEHGDHFLGLDDLLCFRRAVAKDQWRPIPTYASEATWAAVEQRFGYLLPSLLEKRLCRPGQALEGAPMGPELACTPIKVDHGPFPKGALGFVFDLRQDGRSLRLGYTGDMLRPQDDPDAFAGLDVLVCQCAFLNEPAVNLANHLSLQAALPMLRRWTPGRVYFVHFTCQDVTPGDQAGNAAIKRRAPAQPLCRPDGQPHAIPQDQESWQATISQVLAEAGLSCQGFAAFDGLRVRL
ncbi:MBL fold metallo-hydrolase [Desulfarculus baarsii]